MILLAVILLGMAGWDLAESVGLIAISGKDWNRHIVRIVGDILVTALAVGHIIGL
jgi:hypothetical protein